MFGFRKQPPPLCPSNTGRMGTAGRVAFANAERSWTEHFDLVSQAADAFKSRGYSVTSHKTWLEHGDSGFAILPQLAEFQPLDSGGVRTVTTMQLNHPTLVPGGLFEYQHSTGDNMVDSLTKGVDQWVQTDFVTLLDALRPKPQTCTTMEMTFPAKDGQPPRTRRAVLGPIAHMAQNPPDGPEEHPFCPCCLLTNSFEAFRSLIEADGFYGLRLFAARAEDGKPMADCRVNGDDWDAGAQALREYVGSWPAAGIEFRKQYVIVQSVAQSSQAASSPA
jgi:Family of unknown function (DUF6348)